MPFTFGGAVVRDPQQVIEDCIEQGLPTRPFAGIANCYVNPLGFEPATGMILMSAEDVAGLDLNDEQTLVVADVAGNSLTFPSVYVQKTQVVTPSGFDDPSAAVAVWLTDLRWYWRRWAINTAYNLWNDSAQAFFTGTTNSGTPWTWQGMFNDVWETSSPGFSPGMGAPPTLPFTPDGTPQNFNFYGSTMFEALKTILDKIGCTIRYDPTQNIYAVVALTSQIDLLSTVLWNTLQKNGQLAWDSLPKWPTYLKLPAQVRCLFLKSPAPTDGSSPYYTIDTADPAPLPEQGTLTIVNVLDDLTANYVGASLQNSSALSSRAASITAEWFAKARSWQIPEDLHFANIQPGFNSWEQVLAVAYAERSDEYGIRTEILHGPKALADQLPMTLRTEDPLDLVMNVPSIGQHRIIRSLPSSIRVPEIPPPFNLTVDLVGGSSYTNINQINLNASQFALTQPAANQVTVALNPASFTQSFVTNICAQSGLLTQDPDSLVVSFTPTGGDAAAIGTTGIQIIAVVPGADTPPLLLIENTPLTILTAVASITGPTCVDATTTLCCETAPTCLCVGDDNPGAYSGGQVFPAAYKLTASGFAGACEYLNGTFILTYNNADWACIWGDINGITSPWALGIDTEGCNSDSTCSWFLVTPGGIGAGGQGAGISTTDWNIFGSNSIVYPGGRLRGASGNLRSIESSNNNRGVLWRLN